MSGWVTFKLPHFQAPASGSTAPNVLAEHKHPAIDLHTGMVFEALQHSTHKTSAQAQGAETSITFSRHELPTEARLRRASTLSLAEQDGLGSIELLLIKDLTHADSIAILSSLGYTCYAISPNNPEQSHTSVSILDRLNNVSLDATHPDVPPPSSKMPEMTHGNGGVAVNKMLERFKAAARKNGVAASSSAELAAFEHTDAALPHNVFRYKNAHCGEIFLRTKSLLQSSLQKAAIQRNWSPQIHLTHLIRSLLALDHLLLRRDVEISSFICSVESGWSRLVPEAQSCPEILVGIVLHPYRGLTKIKIIQMWPKIEILARELMAASGYREEGAVKFWLGTRLARELEPGLKSRGREKDDRKRRASEEAKEELVQRLKDLCVH